VGTAVPPPSATGSVFNAAPVGTNTPTRRLDDLVTPLNDQGLPDPKGSFLKPGASTIYREQGQRLIAIKFEVRGRDLASTVAEARAAVDPLLKPPYRAEWSGEFKQMEQAEARMARMFLLSLAVIALLLYLAFRSFLDAAVVFANVLAMVIGGVWALKLAGLNFNISAAVGFISVLGVAVMNGLLFVSAFNAMRAKGVPLDEALARGTRQLVRPVVMTAGGDPGPVAGRVLHEDGLRVAAPAGGGRRGRDALHDPRAGARPPALQLLRRPHAAGRRRRPGALIAPCADRAASEIRATGMKFPTRTGR
jgi:cobalt-zinc-cadmium resistance protein CzcA